MVYKSLCLEVLSINFVESEAGKVLKALKKTGNRFALKALNLPLIRKLYSRGERNA